MFFAYVREQLATTDVVLASDWHAPESTFPRRAQVSYSRRTGPTSY